MILSIELNDTGILAVSEGGGSLSPNPGYALLENDSVLVGREAARHARLSPRRIHDRFWERIDTLPLRRPYPGHLSTADLVHAHLEQVWRESGDGVDDALLAIPGRYTDEQLGLILGVARTCGIPVSGMVDSAVAATADRGFQGELLVVDLQLHAAVVTVLTFEHGPVRRGVAVDDVTGVFPLIDAIAKHAAGLFLRTTRFDPLHRAETEQALYDQLPQWTRDLRRNESLPVAVDSGGRSYEIELTRRGVIAAVRGQLDRLVDLVDRNRNGAPATVVLSHAASQFPGIASRFRQGHAVETLPIAAAAAGALKNAGKIIATGDSLPFITRLAVNVPDPVTTEAAPEPRADTGPTHLLHDGLAHPIDERPLVIGVEPPEGGRRIVLTGNTAGISRSHCRFFRRDGAVVLEDHSTYGSFVNERSVDGAAAVTAGDVVRVGTPGIELQLIIVVDADGAT